MATCDLFRKIVECEDVATDQEHVRVCIDSNTEIADRTAAILCGGSDPLPEMIRSAVRLEGMGADVLIMPCNTAHYFYDTLVKYVKVPFLHMPGETAARIADKGIKTVGLLATDGTIQSGVYSKAFEKRNIDVLVPETDEQKEVMGLIYDGVKAGRTDYDTARFIEVVNNLLGRGAEVLVLGCTELPVAYDMWNFDFPAVDPTLVLAERAVEFVRKGGNEIK